MTENQERYFKLDEYRNPVPCEMRDFKVGISVANEQIGDSQVSTVFLGINHQFGDGPPVLWETMVFGGPLDQEQRRCSGGWDDALKMHAAMVSLVRGEPPQEDALLDDPQPSRGYQRTPAIGEMREIITKLERGLSERDDPNLANWCVELRENVMRLESGCDALRTAMREALAELEDRYDGASDSGARWLGSPIRILTEALK